MGGGYNPYADLNNPYGGFGNPYGGGGMGAGGQDPFADVVAALNGGEAHVRSCLFACAHYKP